MSWTQKKYFKRNFDKGTEELTDMKQAVVTIHRTGLDHFEGQSKECKGQFKLDSGLLKTTFSSIISELYKKRFGGNIEYQDTELYTMFIVPFDDEFFKTNYENKDQTCF